MLAVARRLEAAGFSADQAEAIIGAVRGIGPSPSVVTRLEPAGEAGRVRSELRREIAELKVAIMKGVVLFAMGLQTVVIVGALVMLTKGLP